MTSQRTKSIKTIKDYFASWNNSPLQLIEDCFKLIPERDNLKFVRGKHLSRQQHDFFLCVEAALRGEEFSRISIKSGHGTGKTTDIALLIIAILLTKYNCQIACTANTSGQLYDILWKEIGVWLNYPKLPKNIKNKLVWESQHVRVAESPETWFARAKTASKEQPEALAGIHGPFVLYIADESSGIADPIFRTMEGALTGNYLVVLVSNPTRNRGYFYDTHNKDKANWQCLTFSSEDSPLVEAGYCERLAQKYGKDSDEYKIRVLGEFPAKEAMDDKGYISLFSESDIHEIPDQPFIGRIRLGIDPAGKGENKTSFVARDNLKAKRLFSEDLSNPKGIAGKASVFMKLYDIQPLDVYVDSFGLGAEVIQELAMLGFYVNARNGGDHTDETKAEGMANLRARGFNNMKLWLRKGGELVKDECWQQILGIYYTYTVQSQVFQIMPKKDMRKLGIVSPDEADALSLTLYDSIVIPPKPRKSTLPRQPVDRFSVV